MTNEPDPTPPPPVATNDPEWEARLQYWRKRLGRLRLGVEPIGEQLDRYWRATIVLSLIPIGIGLIIVSLFTAFERPDIGAIVALVLFLPIIAGAWLDYARLRARARGYLRDLQRFEMRQDQKKTAG